jgi:chloramphenicol O-acetyltransferase type A
MRKIDMRTWSRRKHFEVYRAFDHPHFGMCADVDVTSFYATAKQRGYSLNLAIVYALTRTANGIAEFRQRIRGGEVVEHEIVHPSTTILTEEELFSFCTIEYVEDFAAFAAGAEEKIAYLKENPTLEDEPGQDDLLFMTAIPWVSFTSFRHPVHLQPADSVPRLAWGKIFEEGERRKMPLDVQVHHALMDGVHVGKYFAGVQAIFDRPGFLLGEA